MIISIENDNLPSLGCFKYFDYPDLKIELLVIKSKAEEFKVISSFCPHFGGPLTVKDGNLHCNFHDYSFDIETGVCLNRNFGGKCLSYDFFRDENGLSIVVE